MRIRRYKSEVTFNAEITLRVKVVATNMADAKALAEQAARDQIVKHGNLRGASVTLWESIKQATESIDEGPGLFDKAP
jgi:hypothetical protein